jgi:hypothetical protein
VSRGGAFPKGGKSERRTITHQRSESVDGGRHAAARYGRPAKFPSCEEAEPKTLSF